jgi:hypothetical protein
MKHLTMIPRTAFRLALFTAALLSMPLAQAADMSKADYRVAIEKCDAQTGDAKSACVSRAKMTFGQN